MKRLIEGVEFQSPGPRPGLQPSAAAGGPCRTGRSHVVAVQFGGICCKIKCEASRTRRSVARQAAERSKSRTKMGGMVSAGMGNHAVGAGAAGGSRTGG